MWTTPNIATNIWMKFDQIPTRWESKYPKRTGIDSIDTIGETPERHPPSIDPHRPKFAPNRNKQVNLRTVNQPYTPRKLKTF